LKKFVRIVRNDKFVYIERRFYAKCGKFIREEGVYKAHDFLGSTIYYVSNDGETERISSKKAKQIFAQLKDIETKKRSLKFCLISYGPNGTGWISDFLSLDEETEISEDENFYYISGNFFVKREKYHRNFDVLAGYAEKEIKLVKERYSKKDDNIKIIDSKTNETIYINPKFVREIII